MSSERPATAAARAAQRPAWYHWLLNAAFRGLARLPLPVLYGLAGVIYGLLAYVVRYRWRVVLSNLRHSFPEKTEPEVRRIGRQFYWHFAQLVVEILKLAAIRPADLARRVRFVNPELADEVFARNQPVLALGSHMGNWEWILGGAALQWDGKAAGVYKPLMDSFFEQLMRRVRTRLGAQAVPMRDTLRYLARRRAEGHILSLLTDQAAGPEDRPYWTTFLHQDTSFFTGSERIAAQLGCAVLYVGIRRVRRGYYEITFTVLPHGELAAAAAPGEYLITEAFARQLERDIRAAPAQYLWTHRRWKHKR